MELSSHLKRKREREKKILDRLNEDINAGNSVPATKRNKRLLKIGDKTTKKNTIRMKPLNKGK